MSIKLSGASGGGGAPSGDAGGGLSGTYPNPDVVATASGTNSSVMKRSSTGGFAAIGTSFVLDATTGLNVDLPDAATPPPITIKSGDALSGGNGANVTITAGVGDGGGSVGGNVVIEGGATNASGGVILKSSPSSAQQIKVLPDGVTILGGAAATNNDIHITAGTSAGRIFMDAGYPSGSVRVSTGVLALVIEPTGDALFQSSVGLETVGSGFYLTEGANATMGSAVLSGGTVTVATQKVTSSSRIFITANADGGVPGWLRVSSRVNDTSFTITSSSVADTSTVSWIIFEPF